MTKNIPFDTLHYAQLLKTCGVDDPEGQSTALAAVITQNIYTKDEVEKMIEAALNQFDKRTQTLSENFSERTYALDKRIDLNFKEMENRINGVEARIENRIDKSSSRNLYLTISILGTLIAVVTTISSLVHYLWR